MQKDHEDEEHVERTQTNPGSSRNMQNNQISQEEAHRRRQTQSNAKRYRKTTGRLGDMQNDQVSQEEAHRRRGMQKMHRNAVNAG